VSQKGAEGEDTTVEQRAVSGSHGVQSGSGTLTGGYPVSGSYRIPLTTNTSYDQLTTNLLPATKYKLQTATDNLLTRNNQRSRTTSTDPGTPSATSDEVVLPDFNLTSLLDFYP
jgi:hypothetical protein